MYILLQIALHHCTVVNIFKLLEDAISLDHRQYQHPAPPTEPIANHFPATPHYLSVNSCNSRLFVRESLLPQTICAYMNSCYSRLFVPIRIHTTSILLIHPMHVKFLLLLFLFGIYATTQTSLSA